MNFKIFNKFWKIIRIIFLKVNDNTYKKKNNH